MTRKELELFIIEAASLALVAECRSFCKFYNAEGIEVTFELKGDKSEIYLNDRGETSLLTTLDYQSAILAWRNPSLYVMDRFSELEDKYNLQPPGMSVTPITIENTEVEGE